MITTIYFDKSLKKLASHYFKRYFCHIMANRFIGIYLHLVFAVKNRESFLPAVHRPRIYAYMSGVFSKFGHKAFAIGGMDDHVHILFSYDPKQALADLVRELKSSTSLFIYEQHLCRFKFAWQAGYGCFSYSHERVDVLCNYILHQPEHHKGITLEDEMKTMLDRFNIPYDPQYLVKSPE